MNRSRIVVAVGAGAVVAALVAAPSWSAHAPHHVVARAGFDHPRGNPWFPLRPGQRTLLRGTDEGKHLRERVRVTHRTRVIDGVATRAVRDVLRRADGSLAEATTDWYADDSDGNVWYFGERTATYDRHGHLQSREGSWIAGVAGAHAGVIMPSHPHATDAYRQEYRRGHAEDQAWVVGFKPAVHVPMGRLRHVVRTFEWSRLEPHVLSTKLYARGIGIAREADLVGGSEEFEVVSVHHGG
jgi:hypothetical protein